MFIGPAAIRRHAASLHRPDPERQSVHHATQARSPASISITGLAAASRPRAVRH